MTKRNVLIVGGIIAVLSFVLYVMRGCDHDGRLIEYSQSAKEINEIIDREEQVIGVALKDQPTKTTDGVLEILTKYMTSDRPLVYVKGVLRNNSDRRFAIVEIRFNIYDINMNQVATASDSIQNFEPYGKWSYNAMATCSLEDTKYYYKLTSIQTWDYKN